MRKNKHAFMSALFMRPDGTLRRIHLGFMDLPSAKGQVTKMINRGASTQGFGAVVVNYRGDDYRIIAQKRNSKWCNLPLAINEGYAECNPK